MVASSCPDGCIGLLDELPCYTPDMFPLRALPTSVLTTAVFLACTSDLPEPTGRQRRPVPPNGNVPARTSHHGTVLGPSLLHWLVM